MVTVISKSRFMIGLGCPKLLWCMFNAPEKIPQVDAATQAIFDQGNEVGALAKLRFPGGFEVTEKGYDKSAAQTRELLKKKKPVYEGSFLHKSAFCKADILVPAKDDWDLIEVKSATSVKEEYILEVAFQRYCAEGAGLHVRNCYLMHVNNEYVRKGAIDPKKFFTLEDITEQVNEVLPQIWDQVIALLKIIKGPMPKPLLGVECVDPAECAVCAQDLPKHNVTELYRMGKKAYALINQGVVLIKDLPKDVALNEKQKLQYDCVKSGKKHVDKAAIGAFLKSLRYPLHLLDFETVYPAIPLFDGMRPYQHVPFQLSLHIVDKPGAKPRHVEFLAENADDPRPGIVKALAEIGTSGTVLAFNMSFEKSVIEHLAEAFPKERWLHPLIDRFDDLIVPFRNFAYYDPAQHGSCSIKAVLPALTGKSYEHLEISQGGEASVQFLNAMYKGEGKITAKLRAALLEYCGQDTMAMLDIIRVLEKQVG